MSLSFAHDLNFNHLAMCPNCDAPWLVLLKEGVGLQVAECVDAIKTSAVAIKGWQRTLQTAGYKGFSLTLEISEEAFPASADKD